MGVIIKASAPAKPFTMADMKDGQLAITSSGLIVQCFDSTAYGANKKHWVSLGRTSATSWSVDKNAVGPDCAVRLLKVGDQITIC